MTQNWVSHVVHNLGSIQNDDFRAVWHKIPQTYMFLFYIFQTQIVANLKTIWIDYVLAVSNLKQQCILSVLPVLQ